MTAALRDTLKQAAAIGSVRVDDDGPTRARQRAATRGRRQRQSVATTAVVVLAAVLAVVFDGDSRQARVVTVSPSKLERERRTTSPPPFAPRTTGGSNPATAPASSATPRSLTPGTLPVLSPPPTSAPPPGTVDPGRGAMAFVRGNDIYVRRNGSLVRLTEEPAYERHHPQWSPDGKHLVFARSRDVDPDPAMPGTPNEWELWVVDAAGGPERVLHRGSYTAFYPTWLPDGRRIKFTRGETTYQPVTGTFMGANYEEWLIDADGSNPRKWEGPVWASFSYDGTQVAYSCDVAGPDSEVCVADADDYGNERVVPGSQWHSAAFLASPIAWSRDGRSLALGGHDGLLLIGTDGSDKHIAPRDGLWPSWSPDGSTVAYQGSGCLQAVDRDGSNVRCIGDPSDRDAAWSPR